MQYVTGRAYSSFTLAAAALLTCACAHKNVTASAHRMPSAVWKSSSVAKNSVAAAMNRQAVNAVETAAGDPDAAILRARVESNPADTAARLELARYYQRRGFPEVALEHLRLACERDIDSSAAHVALAKVLRQEQLPLEAASVLRAFSERHPNDVQVLAWRGVLEDEAGDWKAGEAASRRAIALAPQRDDLQNNLGYSLLEQGRKKEAAEAFRAALALNPRSAVARDNLGLALADNPREAVLNWQSIEGPASAHNNMAAALIDEGHYSEARAEIQKSLGYDAHHTAALSNLQLLSELDGKPAQIAASQARTNRFALAWRRLWAGKSRQQPKDAGIALAARQN